MPSVEARRFTALLGATFGDDGVGSKTELRRLVSAKEKIADPNERAAAEKLLALVRHDRELDENEVGPSRRALLALLGGHEGRVPAAIERVLRGAVPAANVRVKHYDLELDLSGDGPRYPARATITLEKAAPAELVLEIDRDRLTIDDVKVRGRSVPFRVEPGRLHVEAKGAEKIDVRYQVRATHDENGYGLIHDARSGTFSTLTWPTLTGALFPSSSATKDGVTATVNVKTKPGVDVVGAGSGRRGKLAIDAPVPPYAIALYAGEFTGVPEIVSRSGVRVSVHGHGKSVRESTRREYQRAVADAIDYFSKWLGPYRYGDRLRLVEVEGDYGGMEHAGAVALMVGAMRAKDSAVETAVHETAHHWFGDNLRVADNGEFWMSEGFTNYITYRFLAEREGPRKLVELFDYAKDAVKSALHHRPHALDAPAYTDVREIFDDIPYELGPWILRMMETQLGTERFDQVLSKWYRANNFEAVTTREFLDFVKAETGEDVSRLYRAWSRIEKVPSFRDRSNIEGTRVHFQLSARTDVPEGLKIPVLVEGAKQRVTLMIDPEKPETIDVGFPVKRLRWDPERRVLADVTAAR